jgi:hypothetical protein
MLRVRTVFTGVAGTPWYNNLFFTGTDSLSADAAVDAAGDFWEAVDVVISDQVDWATEAEVLVIDESTGQATDAFTVTPIVGTGEAGTDIMPRALQALCRLQTGVFIGGRRLSGRIFIPGTTEGGWTGGVLIPGNVTLITAAATTNLIGHATSQVGVYSRKNGVFFAATSASTWNEGAVLRSRRD